MITYNRQKYFVIETVFRNGIAWGKLNISTSDRPAHIWWPTGKTEYLYTCAERPTPLVIEMSADMLKSVSHARGVDIRVVEKPTICMDWLKYAPLFITPKNARVYWAAEVGLSPTVEDAAA